MAKIDELFRYCNDHEGSDLHLGAGLEPRIRRHGELESVEGWSTLTPQALLTLMAEITNEAQWRKYQETSDLDFAYGLEGVARFRCNYLGQENGPAAVFRIIPQKILSIEDLGLPAAIAKLAQLEQGLVLVTGPTGSGKSTTLAAIIDRINSTYSRHIVTIEDPIEFVHPNRQCVFSQREVGNDTESFSAALRAAIRQDADVILVGEMRDLETISLAMTAAEMGSLVFATLHTNGAASTIDRLVDSYPADEQSQVRESLAESLAGIVSQLLLPTADGNGRVAATEILFRTTGLPNIIREATTTMIRSVIQSGRGEGMQMMDDSIMQFLEQKRITPRAAYLRAAEKSRFESSASAGSG
ncbi:MAG: type IV pilus twitching motility protein PilT [Thermoanaerobaculia bacterium]